MAWPNGQQRRVQLDIQAAQVAGALSDFPILLTADNLPPEMLDTGDANAPQLDGGDIRFGNDADCTVQYAAEIVSFTPTAGGTGASAEFHVKIPSVSGAVNTPLWMAWKTSGTTAKEPDAGQYGRNAVWSGATGDYIGVWHGDDLIDSTGNGQDLTAVNGATFNNPGKVGGCFTVVIENDQSFNALKAVAGMTPPIALSAWHRLAKVSSNSRTIIGLGQVGNNADDWTRLYIETNERNKSQWDDGVIRDVEGSFVSAQTWEHSVVSWEPTGGELYLDGVPDGSTTTTVTGNTDTDIIGIGTLFRAAALLRYDGDIDEARIAGFNMEDTWIATEYANQNSPITFVDTGTPEDTGPPPEPVGNPIVMLI